MGINTYVFEIIEESVLELFRERGISVREVDDYDQNEDPYTFQEVVFPKGTLHTIPDHGVEKYKLPTGEILSSGWTGPDRRELWSCHPQSSTVQNLEWLPMELTQIEISPKEVTDLVSGLKMILNDRYTGWDYSREEALLERMEHFLNKTCILSIKEGE